MYSTTGIKFTCFEELVSNLMNLKLIEKYFLIAKKYVA